MYIIYIYIYIYIYILFLVFEGWHPKRPYSSRVDFAPLDPGGPYGR